MRTLPLLRSCLLLLLLLLPPPSHAEYAYTHVRRLSEQLHGTMLVVGNQTAPEAMARLVSVAHGSEPRVSLVFRGWPQHEATVLGWDGLELCLGSKLPHQRIKVASGTTSLFAGFSDLTAAQVQEQPSTVGGFARRVREQPPGATPYAIFDLPLPTVCPAYSKTIDMAALNGVFAGVDGYYLRDGYPRLYMHPRGALSAAHIDSSNSYFWLHLIEGEKTVRVWPMGTQPGADGVAGVPHEEFTLGAGDIFFGAGGVVHEVVTTAPSVAVSANYFPFASALHGAAHHADAARVAALVARGGGGGGGGGDEAAETGDVALDMDAPDHAGHTPLHFAAKYNRGGNLETIEALLDGGASVDARAHDGQTALHLAATAADAAAVAALLARGADADAADAHGEAPLHACVRLARPLGACAAAAAALLRGGAAADAREGRGATPLHLAAADGDAPTTAALLRGGADATAVGGGVTPLHLAASSAHGDAALARALLDAGAEVDALAGNGATPLHLASHRGNGALAALLLERGASAGARDAQGSTPAMLARRRGHIELGELLDGGP